MPEHGGDTKPSVSVTWRIARNGGGRTFITCHRGCDDTAVLAALGLELADLYDEPRAVPSDPARRRGRTPSPRAARSAARPAAERPGGPASSTPTDSSATAAPAPRRGRRPAAEIESEHPYCDAAGEVLFTVVRWLSDPKFSTRRHDASGRWKPGAVPAADRVLYRLPEIAPAIAADAPIYVVEGEKDADALAAAGVVATTAPFGAPAVPQPGSTATWSAANKWLPQYTAALAGAHVVIVHDRDPLEPGAAAGQRYAAHIAGELAAVAASVRIVRAAAGKDAADHLAAGHPVDALEPVDLAALRADLAALEDSTAGDVAGDQTDGLAPAQRTAPSGPEPDVDNVIPMPGHSTRTTVDPEPGGGGGGSNRRMAIRRDRFDVVDGSLCQIKTEKVEPTADNPEGWESYAVELINAAPKLRNRLRYELGDGGRSRVEHFDLEVSYGAGDDAESVVLEALDDREWEKVTWVHELPWPVAIDDTSAGRSKLRKAIVQTSGPIPVETLYGRLGWWEIGDRWVYLHAAGAIDQNGPTDRVRVKVPGKYEDFALPAPADSPLALRKALVASLVEPMNSDVPDRLMAPMLCAAYRAVLGYSRVTLLPTGLRGTGKTALAAIGQQHFAPGTDYRRLPFGAGELAGTLPSLEEHRFIVGDMLQVLDDVAPDTGTEAMGKRQNALARSQAERRGKDRRMRDRAGVHPEHKPNGLLAITTEQWAGVDSAETRTVGLEVRKGEFNPLTVYGPLDSDGRPMLRAVVTATMAMHYAARMPLTRWLSDTGAQFRDALVDESNDPGVEARRAESFGDLAVGGRALLDMCLEREAINQEEADYWWARLWAGLLEAKRAMAASRDQRRPHDIALELLRTALLRKTAAVADRATGEEPADPALHGWEPAPGGSVAGMTTWRRVGAVIGWADETAYYLLPTVATEIAAKEARGGGVPWPYNHVSLGAIFADANVVTRYLDKKSGQWRNQVGRTIGALGKQSRVWEIRRDVLFPPVDDDELDPNDPADPNGPPPAGDALMLPLPEPADAPVDDALEPADEIVDADATDDTVAPGALVDPELEHAESKQDEPETALIETTGEHIGHAAGSPAAQPPTSGDDTPTDSQQPAARPAESHGEPRNPLSAGSSNPETGSGDLSGAYRAYDAPALVCAADVGHLATLDGQGRSVELPADLPRGLAALPELCRWAETAVHLGHPGIRRGARHAYGQVWLLPDARARLGLPAHLPQRERDEPESKTAANIRAALESAGWYVAGRAGIAPWTTVYREGGRRLVLVVPEWLATGSRVAVFGEDEPDVDGPTLARRLGLYCATVGIPHQWSPAVTGHQLIAAHRPRLMNNDRPEMPPPARRPALEAEYAWQRAPEPDEFAKRYAHAYDKHAAYLGVASSLQLGYGAARHIDEPFDWTLETWRDVPAYLRFRVPTLEHARLPDPLQILGRGGPRQTLWATTPTIRSLVEFWDVEIDVREGYVWDLGDGTDRILEPWYETLRNALLIAESIANLDPAERRRAIARLKLKMSPELLRAVLELDRGDADAAAVLAAIKGNYRGAIGRLDAETIRDTAHRLWRPDIRHHVVAQSRYAINRNIHKAAEHDVYPLAVLTDCIVIASDEPDPVKALPPGWKLGWTLGSFKHTGTAEMSEIAPLLTRGPRPIATSRDETGNVKEYGLIDTLKGKHRRAE
ncbi:hypothetical protein [Cryptosporangium aurantiacum]|uniref:hypothetical protein n=1 Tax=Cryptosporangium aurantiacum TaxID=134849 RepID=UPI000933BA89|nr:hypothetical protein [Cryptosporangium aurantiacum]